MKNVIFNQALFKSKRPAYYVKSIAHISHYKSVKVQFILGNVYHGVLVPAVLPVNVKSRVKSVSCFHGGHHLNVHSKGRKTSYSWKEKITIAWDDIRPIYTTSITKLSPKTKCRDYPQSARQFSKYIHKSNFINTKYRLMHGFRGIQNAKSTWTEWNAVFACWWYIASRVFHGNGHLWIFLGSSDSLRCMHE